MEKFLRIMSHRLMSFIIIPVLVLVSYYTILGAGEVAIRLLAVFQNTMLALVAYFIFMSLSNGTKSSEALERVYAKDEGSMAAAVVWATIIIGRIITFAALVISTTLFVVK